jgi:hypothetical protein
LTFATRWSRRNREPGQPRSGWFGYRLHILLRDVGKSRIRLDAITTSRKRGPLTRACRTCWRDDAIIEEVLLYVIAVRARGCMDGRYRRRSCSCNHAPSSASPTAPATVAMNRRVTSPLGSARTFRQARTTLVMNTRHGEGESDAGRGAHEPHRMAGVEVAAS